MQIKVKAARADSGGRGLQALLDRWIAGYGAVLVILTVGVWDMVFKPGL